MARQRFSSPRLHDPRMCQHARANLDAFGVGTGRHHLADVFVTQRHGKFHAAVGQTHPLAAAKVEPSVRQMQIAMAHAGCQNFQQDFTAFRLRCGLLVKL
jgi:hypothetical protein